MAQQDSVLDRILATKLIAIVRLNSADQLLQVAEAIAAGGIDIIEFTLTTPGALEVLQKASAYFGDRVVLGAGTVLDSETGLLAIQAGARFIVSPILNLDLVRLCRRYSVPALPGAYTPTEIMQAWEAGADLVKVFPAETLGPAYIKAVKAPLPQVRLVPTGGISTENARTYLDAGAVALGVGSSLVDAHLVHAGAWEALQLRAQNLWSAVHRGAISDLQRA
ncbi:MAG: bifunctional 4-hydroxy-2-oxoglutarate aldolase/2-dehydro-3-deoxy-phosphogluconate aldolase [Chloroflexi bacterium]|nr:bifunctional 4-hydroxy-2-oxoglutarate aldolase/2-dehydro-3-deoxy-phosphogluconate aldolase [Chloroflexota bacterium]